jgi:hypothetical protein
VVVFREDGLGNLLTPHARAVEEDVVIEHNFCKSVKVTVNALGDVRIPLICRRLQVESKKQRKVRFLFICTYIGTDVRYDGFSLCYLFYA